jgi:hypothetical protein
MECWELTTKWITPRASVLGLAFHGLEVEKYLRCTTWIIIYVAPTVGVSSTWSRKFSLCSIT